jgi:excisionase family DNA binding protein
MRTTTQLKTQATNNSDSSMDKPGFEADSSQFYGASASESIADSIEKFDRALNAGDLSSLLNVHRLTIYRAASSGVLPCFRIGSCVRFDPRAVAAWLRERGCL